MGRTWTGWTGQLSREHRGVATVLFASPLYAVFDQAPIGNDGLEIAGVALLETVFWVLDTYPHFFFF